MRLAIFIWGLLCTTCFVCTDNFAYLQENPSNWERGAVWINIYNVQFVRIDSLLHDWAIYKISTFCTSVAWQIIEAILRKAISGNLASRSSSSHLWDQLLWVW